MTAGGPFWARHYGFGAARIPLGAAAHRPDPDAELADALQQLDLSTSRLLRAAPLAMLLSVLFLAGISALPFREPASDTQIVMLTPEPIAEDLPEPLVQERPPEPLPAAAEPEPAPPPAKPAAALPARPRTGSRTILGAGAGVTEGFVVPPRSLVLGVPGRIVRDVTDEEFGEMARSAQGYVDNVWIYLDD